MASAPPAPNAAFRLPNVRRLFVPDKGYMLYEADLSGADGQVVAWEADDAELKQWLRDGTDMHVRHAIEVGRDTEIASLSPTSYRYYQIRQSYKHATHGVHYGASDYALSRHTSIGWPRHKASLYIANYFARRPGVREWHNRTQRNLETNRTATNRFGYRIVYFDRVDGLLPQALAWVPQSTVALVCFKGALRLRKALPWVEILVQVHDSLLFQVPLHRSDSIDLFRQHLAVEVPYPNDPLVIPWGLARSERSWGEVSKV